MEKNKCAKCMADLRPKLKLAMDENVKLRLEITDLKMQLEELALIHHDSDPHREDVETHNDDSPFIYRYEGELQ